MALYNPNAQPSHLFRGPIPAPPPRARVLLVHGAWHGAWFWERWQRLFCERGYDTYAVDLPGHGTRADDGWIWRAGINDYVECVHRAVEEIGECVIMGHSMGGFTVMKYLEQYGDAHPAAVLLAPVPHTGFPIGNLLQLVKIQPSIAAKLLLSMPIPLTSEQVVRHGFFSDDIDDETVEMVLVALCRESARSAMEMTLLKRGKPAAIRTKTLAVHAQNDTLIPGDKVKALAAALPDGEYLELVNAAHDVPLDTRWEAHGRQVCDWLDKVGAHTAVPELSPPPNWKHAKVERLISRPPADHAAALPALPSEDREMIHRPENKE